MKLAVLNTKGEKTKKVFDLNDVIFASDANMSVLRQVIHVHMQSSRTGTAKAKGRSEVAGTTKKPWANNKMGMARAGDKKSPIFRGGGVSHGPLPMNYGLKVNKKMKQIARNLALTQAVKANKLFIVEDITLKDEKLTGQVATILAALASKAEVNTKSVIMYMSEANKNLVLGVRNIPGVQAVQLTHMHAYDLLAPQAVIILESAMETLNGSKAKTAETKETKDEPKVKKTTKTATKKTTPKAKKA